MNSHYALRYLAFELNATFQKASFELAATSRKNELGLYFSRGEDGLKITVSTDPQRTAVFADPRVSVKKNNTATFFNPLQGKTVQSVSVAAEDRFLYIQFEHTNLRLTLKMFGNDPNVFLTEGDVILEAFKHPSRFEGQPEPQAFSLSTVPLEEAKGGLRKKILKAFPQLPRAFADELIAYHELDTKPLHEVGRFLDQVHHQLLHAPEPRLLEDGRFSLFSAAHFPTENAESFDDINTAVRVAFFAEKRENTFLKELALLKKRAEKLRSRFEKALTEADNAQKSIEKAEWYEQNGNILVAHAHLTPEPSKEIELQDFYNEGALRRIKIDPRLNLAENAEKYFNLKKKAERAFETAAAFAEETEAKLEELSGIEEQLNNIADMKALEALQKAHEGHELFRKKSGREGESLKPYKIGRIGRFEVWIGKNAKSNDRIMHDSHKEDIWLHAKGVGGSHVLIRMNRAQTEPDKSQLEKAAGWAAWYSKAKGSSFAPVIKTRRKFVRKPKQGAAGAVLIDREEVLIVPPVEPLPGELED
ncbi:putative component of the ribosome quality control (RQC) complex, YloA/Tae2 family [Cyclonatronum proteinivorum]|uniref:Putative component of the ribosome quality control (RQC) complex, YloA/Tae2 family n=1 Tax=Cyclonatronum proteinivorum TaxID=1457365 RepID=A0A345UKF5_9BACT|nr:NFACT RNA binding domain-containing protein [Cyclonatronum proteinivorum]AXJ00957.1 putative component of the ribosome quality control (RQC) complex, YloA/Tae2 family [Cyclonatronum proteinivorum]